MAFPSTSDTPEAARRARPWGLLAVVAVALVPLLFALLPAGDRITFDGGLELLSASASQEATRNGRLQLTLRFHASRPLPKNYVVFVHAESTSGELGACRMTAERAPDPPATRWAADSEIVQELQVPVRASCELDRLELRAGLYDVASGERLRLRAPMREDQRVFVGVTDVVDATPRRDARGADRARAVTARAARGSGHLVLVVAGDRRVQRDRGVVGRAPQRARAT